MTWGWGKDYKSTTKMDAQTAKQKVLKKALEGQVVFNATAVTPGCDIVETDNRRNTKESYSIRSYKL